MQAPAAGDHIAIVATEKTSHGAELAWIDEHGDRRELLLQPAATRVRDTNPAVSPDGKWIVFASSRGRSIDETNLWIAPVVPGAAPVPLTTGPAIDAQPAWAPDGSLVFASTRDGGDFDLYRAELVAEPRPHLDHVVALTDAPGHEVTPTVAHDGSIAYASVASLGGDAVDSHLEVRAPDGAIRKLTSGPADSTPAVSPDGTQVAFSRPFVRGDSVDAELWTMPLAGGDATRVIDLPLTDETGPVWSPDGRYLFATSLLRGSDGHTVFSSVIFVDLRETPRIARMLRDRAGAIARLTPAIVAPALDAAALRSDPEYLPELAKIMAGPILEAKQHGP